MKKNKQSVFETLNKINVNEHTEKKAGLTYLSWAWAWGEVKKLYPKASYTIYENKEGWNYHTDGGSAWVKTGVEIEELEHIEYLPVMDYRNKSIPIERVSSFDVNKAIQRSLTKAIARHGLGLYIYAGEDLPEATEQPVVKKVKVKEVKEVVKETLEREDVKLVDEVFPNSNLELFYTVEGVLNEALVGKYLLEIGGKKYKGELIKTEKEHLWKTSKGGRTSPVNKCPEGAKFYPIVEGGN